MVLLANGFVSEIERKTDDTPDCQRHERLISEPNLVWLGGWHKYDPAVNSGQLDHSLQLC